ncbi:hypothetical protein ARMGADRAFT_1041113 [Armillaria gallica]|uniref:Uncharacterized protein n=1 Tax=Armillaria gallica TaxID=47427 RepID=A0A2H3C7F2_ARMGA|nr:hypothetical protein ARMGADRAFT_1041113 [Armillaria gallica]
MSQDLRGGAVNSLTNPTGAMIGTGITWLEGTTESQPVSPRAQSALLSTEKYRRNGVGKIRLVSRVQHSTLLENSNEYELWLAKERRRAGTWMHMEAIHCKHMLRVVPSEIRMLGDAFILMCEKTRGKVYPHYSVENQKDVQVSGGPISTCLIKLSLPSIRIMRYFHSAVMRDI